MDTYLRYKGISLKVLGVSLVVAVMLAAVGQKAFGQTGSNGFNLSTSPVVLVLNTKPGGSTSSTIQVKNNNLTTEHLKVSLLRFTSDNKSGTPLLVDPEANDDFPKWVTFSENKFDAEPNVWKSINVTISPPSTAAFGYYYSVVFSRDSSTSGAGVTNLNASVAVPILLDVNAPGEVRKSDITQFKVNKNVSEFLPVSFTVQMKNSGNVHVAPRGNIFITKGGQNIATLEVNQNKGNILPKTTRDFTADWSDGTPAYKVKKVNGAAVVKNDKPVANLDWSGFVPGKLRFGKYHAKVAMVYSDGTGDVSSLAELDFWVIPWRIIGVGVLVLVLIAAGVWTLLVGPLRKRVKKQPAKYER